MPPKVSIGMPVYNGEKYMSKALDDLLAQTFKDFELIISDNGSTDKTEEICRRYEAKDRRIRYHRQPRNLGQQANFTFLLHQARGEFFMWAASDDRWDKEFISALLKALKSNRRYASAFCPFVYVDEEDRPLSRTQMFDFSSQNVVGRISKFSLMSDPGRDAFFYGLHRRELIQDLKIPVWWWINAKTPMNIAFPVLVFFLARGGYVQAGTSPLWFNRLYINSNHRHSANFTRSRLVGYLAFLLRKMNVFYESVRAVYQGTRSVSVILAAIPILAARCLYDCIQHTIFIVCRYFRIVLRRLKKVAGSD